MNRIVFACVLALSGCMIDQSGLGTLTEPVAQPTVTTTPESNVLTQPSAATRLNFVVRCSVNMDDPFNVVTYELYDFSDDLIFISGSLTNHEGSTHDSRFWTRQQADQNGALMTLSIVNSSDQLVWELSMDPTRTTLYLKNNVFSASSTKCHKSAN